MATKKPNLTLEERLTIIEDRNLRVTQDKAWETSITRRASICIVTYVCACIIFLLQNQPNVFASACIPVMGYLLSTLSLPHVRQWWQKRSH